MSAHQDARMYESKYPEVDDVVMVQVKSIAEMGAYVGLLEYNGIEGMILLSELSRRRIRSITKLIKVITVVYNACWLKAIASLRCNMCGENRWADKSLLWCCVWTKRRVTLIFPKDV